MKAKTDAAQQKTSDGAVLVKDTATERGQLKMLGGSKSDDWNKVLADQARRTLWTGNSNQETLDREISAAMAALIGIGPRDEVEGMIAGQLLAAHNAAMECYRRAMIPEQSFQGYRESLNQANKLSRTYTGLLEALNRYRGKGQQKVTVEHVHVHDGGKAVVGTVAPVGGSGGRAKSEDQPHAKQTPNARQSSMRGEHA